MASAGARRSPPSSRLLLLLLLSRRRRPPHGRRRRAPRPGLGPSDVAEAASAAAARGRPLLAAGGRGAGPFAVVRRSSPFQRRDRVKSGRNTPNSFPMRFLSERGREGGAGGAGGPRGAGGRWRVPRGPALAARGGVGAAASRARRPRQGSGGQDVGPGRPPGSGHALGSTPSRPRGLLSRGTARCPPATPGSPPARSLRAWCPLPSFSTLRCSLPGPPRARCALEMLKGSPTPLWPTWCLERHFSRNTGPGWECGWWGSAAAGLPCLSCSHQAWKRLYGSP